MPAEYQIDSTSAPYVEELLQEYLQEPARLSAEWQGYFETLLRKDPSLRQRASGNGHAKPASLFHPPQSPNGAVRAVAAESPFGAAAVHDIEVQVGGPGKRRRSRESQ